MLINYPRKHISQNVIYRIEENITRNLIIAPQPISLALFALYVFRRIPCVHLYMYTQFLINLFMTAVAYQRYDINFAPPSPPSSSLNQRHKHFTSSSLS